MFSIFATLALSDSPYVVHMNSPMFRDLVINRKDTEVWHVLFVGVHPKENQKEMEEIPAQVARKLRFVLVDTMDEVLKEALAVPATQEEVG